MNGDFFFVIVYGFRLSEEDIVLKHKKIIKHIEDHTEIPENHGFFTGSFFVQLCVVGCVSIAFDPESDLLYYL